MIADSAGGAWTFGGSILTFVFPMLLFIVVAAWLYVTYTKPELVPGHRNPANERPIIHTAVAGPPPPADGQAKAQMKAETTAETQAQTKAEPEAGE